MFKKELSKIKKVSQTLSTKDLKSISERKFLNQKMKYYKWDKRLKRWLYQLDESLTAYQVANLLVEPSYISLETVLSQYSIIPDAVTSYSSITTKKTQSYSNSHGTFYYSSLKEDYYFGFDYTYGDSEKHWVFIAKREKALLDYFYLRSKNLKLSIYDYVNIREKKFDSKAAKKTFAWFAWERFENLEVIDFKLLHRYATKMNKKVKYMALALEEYYERGEKQFTHFIPK